MGQGILVFALVSAQIYFSPNQGENTHLAKEHSSLVRMPDFLLLSLRWARGDKPMPLLQPSGSDGLQKVTAAMVTRLQFVTLRLGCFGDA